MDPYKPVEEVGTDLLRITESLWRSSDSDAHGMRLNLNLLQSGVGRGGEPKFLTYAKMYYEHRYSMLYGLWFQLKQVTTVPTCFTNDYEYPETCVEHAFGSFFCVEDGLARAGNPFANPNSAEARKASYVFQQYHAMNDSSVTQKVTNRLKSIVPASLKHVVTSKCLRIGSSTSLAADPAVTYDESIFRGGWSTGTSRDYYVWILLYALIAPMMSLAGHPDPKAMPYPPRLNALPFHLHELVQTYISFLYVINVPFFLPGQKLRPMLEECTAVLIMHFPYALRKYGREDKLNTKMIEAAMYAKLGDTAKEAITALREWAKHIQDDYDSRKINATDQRDEVLSRLVQIQRAQASDNASLREMLRTVTAQLTVSNAETADVRTELSGLKTDLQEIKGLMLQQQRSNNNDGGSAGQRRISASPANSAAAPIAPAPIAQSTTVTTVTAAVGNLLAPATSTSAPAEAAPVQQQRTGQPPTQQGRNVNDAIWWGAAAKGDEKKIPVSEVMKKLYKMDSKPLAALKRRPLKYMKYQAISTNNNTKYESAMTLVEALMTTKQRKIAIEGKLTPNEAASAFLDLDWWVKKAAAAIQCKSNVSASRRANWLGIGGCIKDATKNIHRKDMTSFIGEYIPRTEWDELKNAADSHVFLPPGKTQTFRQWVDSQLERNKNSL
jgi:hypothetical protein